MHDYESTTSHQKTRICKPTDRRNMHILATQLVSARSFSSRATSHGHKYQREAVERFESPQGGRQRPTSPSNRRGAFRERAAERRLVSGSHSAENAQRRTPRSPDFHKRGSYRAQRQAGLRHSPAEKGTKSVTAGQPTVRL